MADKLNDNEIASEFKRFGETIKLPIDKKKRPILLKKLNHYYAKENPPPKRTKIFARPSRKSQPIAEFSDESQDESESTRNISNITAKRNRTRNNLRESPVKRVQAKDRDNGATVSPGIRARNVRNRQITNVQQMEVYPEEFSDTDTADESLYVEEKSIGINTTMSYEDEDEEEENEIVTHASPRNMSGNLSTISHINTSVNNVDNKVDDEESGQFVSKTILFAMAIFFLALGFSYLYVRKDIFFASDREAAVSQTDLKETTFLENGTKITFTTFEISNGSLPLLKKVHEKLAALKGQYELGEIDENSVRLKRQDIANMLDKETLKNDTQVERILQLSFFLILQNDWDIMAFQSNGEKAVLSMEVEELECRYGNLPLSSRILLALYKVLYGLGLLLMCVFVGVLGIYYLRWMNKKKEKEQQRVYEMVEKIIEILKENFELSERKNDPTNYPTYMAVQHIRDQLIPVPKRRLLQSLWEEAVKFIETNESRIRVETQVIQGEEFNVWRWLQAMPNGHKMWQGQAFGETSQNNVNSLPYGPTPCLKVRNMFDANVEQTTDDWHLDIEESILEKCQDNHGILHIFVDRSSKEGCVYIKCSSCEKAYGAYQALHGWWFDGRLVTVKYLRLEHYHDRFPDSRNCRHPLKPSKPEMTSVSRPYHRSALEMT
ncbi:inner nuclear membrane protein Man1-like [Mya arenaria]|uniref:inner nuclear membrane protein Man1-like n=1 Tax=Mya arenaria TaxID=6604 RepID=UPI0022DF0E01|nr:inner nuclear membrane protein Man1-like [Mya arenaria]